MKCFLTSSPTVGRTCVLNPANGFVDEISSAVGAAPHALFISSDPDNYGFTDGYAEMIRQGFRHIGISLRNYRTLDSRNASNVSDLISESELVVLAGGHVPTQNRFFAETGLRDATTGFDGVVLGISAGSMNSADTVYSPPELDGEALDLGYQRFLKGLNLTQRMIVPHYDFWMNETLDGLDYVNGILRPDSLNRTFYALVDGSYLYSADGTEEIRGESYLIRNGEISPLADKDDVYSLA